MHIANTLIGIFILGVGSSIAHADIHTCAEKTPNRAVAEAYEQRWESALRAKAPSELAELYGDSAVLMPPSDETLVGRKPIADYFEREQVPAADENYAVDLISCRTFGETLHVAANSLECLDVLAGHCARQPEFVGCGTERPMANKRYEDLYASETIQHG